MATKESYHEIQKLLIVASKTTGVEIWTAPGKLRPASYFLSFLVIVYFVSTIHTLHKYSDDPLYMMKVLITLGTVVQLYVKFFVAITRGSEFKEFSDLIEEQLLEPFECGSAAEVAVLQRTGRIIRIVFQLMSGMFFSSGLIFGVYSLYTYYVDDVLMPIFLYELPYYDWSTIGGYVANMVFQVNLLVIGVVGAILIEFLFIMYAFYALAYAEILMVHFRELEALLNDPTVMEHNSSLMRQKWRQCMHGHQESIKLLNGVEALFKLMIFVQVGFSVLSICDGMLLVLLTDWYAAYVFLLVIVFDLIMYFLVGHYVELKMDGLYETIHSVPWYKMPVCNQKEYRFLVSHQQRPLTLTMYGFAPLNFATYTGILKMLYQIFVMLLQYIS